LKIDMFESSIMTNTVGFHHVSGMAPCWRVSRYRRCTSKTAQS